MDCKPHLVSENCDNNNRRENDAPSKGSDQTNVGIWRDVEGLKKLSRMQISNFSLNCCSEYRPIGTRTRWFGHGGPVALPPRSPNLNPLYFFFWGHLMSLVYETPVATMRHRPSSL
ncbi:hypothetical protein TNCV_526571 [Trichonephila clavipes]|nr:hypothetical protein TNCV_526571 [Trichonephila clavipes]